MLEWRYVVCGCFCRVSDSGEQLQTNVSKSVVMVFARVAVEGDWKWGLPKVHTFGH